MKFVRRLGLVLATLTFGFWLFWLVATASLAFTVGKPDVVKGWLTNSGVYGKIVPAIIEQNTKPGGDNKLSSDGSISLSDPFIQQVAKNVFTPAYIQTSSEAIIDGTYGWLEGKTAKPQFNINVADVKTKFATGVGDYLRTRAAGLPACKTQPAQFDIINATCLPKGVNVTTATQQIVQDINSNKEFLPDPALNADTLKTDNNGQKQPYYQDKTDLPRLYRWLHMAPWILGPLALITGVGVVLLHEQRRRGLYRVMVGLLTSGGLLLVYVWLLSFGLNKAQGQLIKGGGTQQDALKTSAFSVLRLAQHDISRIVVIFGVGFVVIGAALGAYLFITRDKHPKTPTPTGAPHSPKPDHSASGT